MSLEDDRKKAEELRRQFQSPPTIDKQMVQTLTEAMQEVNASVSQLAYLAKRTTKLEGRAQQKSQLSGSLWGAITGVAQTSILKKDIQYFINEMKKSSTYQGASNKLKLAMEEETKRNVTKAHFLQAGKPLTHESNAFVRTIGNLGALSNVLGDIAKGAGAIGVVVTFLNTFSKMIAEQGKYFKSVSMMGIDPFSRARDVSSRSLQTASILNNQLRFGGMLNSNELRDAFKGVLEAGVITTGAKGRQTSIETDTLALAKSFSHLAAQAVMLGDSYADLQKQIIALGSSYVIGRKMFNYDNMQRFMGTTAAKYNVNNADLLRMLTAANMSYRTATSASLTAVTRDISVALDKMSTDISSPMRANIISSLLSSNVDIGSFIGLYKNRGNVTSAELGQMTKEKWSTSPLAMAGTYYKRLQNATDKNLGPFISDQILKQFGFQGLEGNIGYKLMESLSKPEVLSQLKDKSFQGMNAADQTKWLEKRGYLSNLSTEERAQVYKVAETQKFLENPLQKIIALLSNMGKSLVQITAYAANLPSVFGISSMSVTSQEFLKNSVDALDAGIADKSANNT